MIKLSCHTKASGTGRIFLSQNQHYQSEVDRSASPPRPSTIMGLAHFTFQRRLWIRPDAWERDALAVRLSLPAVLGNGLRRLFRDSLL
ncbi:hypothetical protein AAFF_G00293710 [Aldrovandia affinis]|uniref:Uncharacterized protein n=1 Tax=Aldrovandia affinis TaxID=143900 RepID=A0AAD7W0R7_9TELE|nr:hypothetical protein AAFF_G00293710 [Aldrovandia affinis]